MSSPYDMATIMQDRGFTLAEFTEERLAKALDDLYDADLDRLMTGVALGRGGRCIRLSPSTLPRLC